VTLYLFALPFTLVKELGWATVPIITVVSFTFMGIEGIAEEIEMPFGIHASFRSIMMAQLIDVV
jgi:ion channel-forming bestrophin family protein